MRLKDKYNDLLNSLNKEKSAIIAFSGGIDSSFLLFSAKKAGIRKILAITAVSSTTSKDELESAKNLAKFIDVEHRIIESSEMTYPEFINNPQNKCYLCKKIRYQALVKIAESENFSAIFEGSNIDDLSDYRPGMQAVKELKIESPLMKFKLSKQEIRSLAKDYNLPNWNKPSNPCLATRVPTGSKISNEKLRKIEKSEDIIKQLGFKIVRVRDFENKAIIEIALSEMQKLIRYKDKIISEIKDIGYKTVEINPNGYKTGAMNKIINLSSSTRRVGDPV